MILSQMTSQQVDTQLFRVLWVNVRLSGCNIHIIRIIAHTVHNGLVPTVNGILVIPKTKANDTGRFGERSRIIRASLPEDQNEASGRQAHEPPWT